MEITNLVNYLVDLRKKESILLIEIPKELRSDLFMFLSGKSNLHEEVDPYTYTIPNSVYGDWLKKLQNTGFDYDINCNKIEI